MKQYTLVIKVYGQMSDADTRNRAVEYATDRGFYGFSGVRCLNASAVDHEYAVLTACHDEWIAPYDWFAENLDRPAEAGALVHFTETPDDG